MSSLWKEIFEEEYLEWMRKGMKEDYPIIRGFQNPDNEEIDEIYFKQIDIDSRVAELESIVDKDLPEIQEHNKRCLLCNNGVNCTRYQKLVRFKFEHEARLDELNKLTGDEKIEVES